MLTPDDCWADYRTSATSTRGRPCLFLDRDGVLIEDTGYPHLAEAITMIPEVIAAVARASAAGFVIGIVSNQSGVARGLFDWAAFAAVQAVIDGALNRSGVRLDFVLACPHHPDAVLVQLRRDHAWRKPRPGMLLAARDALEFDMTRSIMVGDRASDMEAAARASVAHRLFLDPVSDRPAPPGSQPVARHHLEDTLQSLIAPASPSASITGL